MVRMIKSFEVIGNITSFQNESRAQKHRQMSPLLIARAT